MGSHQVLTIYKWFMKQIEYLPKLKAYQEKQMKYINLKDKLKQLKDKQEIYLAESKTTEQEARRLSGDKTSLESQINIQK